MEIDPWGCFFSLSAPYSVQVKGQLNYNSLKI